MGFWQVHGTISHRFNACALPMARDTTNTAPSRHPWWLRLITPFWASFPLVPRPPFGTSSSASSRLICLHKFRSDCFVKGRLSKLPKKLPIMMYTFPMLMLSSLSYFTKSLVNISMCPCEGQNVVSPHVSVSTRCLQTSITGSSQDIHSDMASYFHRASAYGFLHAFRLL